MGMNIEKRAQAVSMRAKIGYREMDLVVGQYETLSRLFVLAERKCVLCIFSKCYMNRKVFFGIAKEAETYYMMRRFRQLFNRITCDKGCEFLDSDKIS